MLFFVITFHTPLMAAGEHGSGIRRIWMQRGQKFTLSLKKKT